MSTQLSANLECLIIFDSNFATLLGLLDSNCTAIGNTLIVDIGNSNLFNFFILYNDTNFTINTFSM